MILFFTIVIPVLYSLLISYISFIFRNLYRKLGDLEIKIIQLELQLGDHNDE